MVLGPNFENHRLLQLIFTQCSQCLLPHWFHCHFDCVTEIGREMPKSYLESAQHPVQLGLVTPVTQTADRGVVLVTLVVQLD